MLLGEGLSNTGSRLFRWRSYVLLAFVPLLALAVLKGEQFETAMGEPLGDMFEAGCILFALAGLMLRAATVGFVPPRTSGRNRRAQVAQVLNTTGMYSLTRNPLYLANCMTYLGIVLYGQSLMLGLAFVLFLALYYERIIMAEEAFLSAKFGVEYTDWTARVPVFLPRFSGWRAPSMPFCWRLVLRRECPGWLATTAMLFAIEVSFDYFDAEAEPLFKPEWIVALTLVTALSLGTLFLKRKTRILNAIGR